MKVTLIALAALMLMACGTEPITDTSGSPARAILDVAMTRPDPARGVIVVRRDRGAEGSACDHRILIDGKPVADLRPGEIVTIYAPPGERIVAMSNHGAICVERIGPAIAVQSEAGKRRTFRTGAGGVAPALVPVAQ